MGNISYASDEELLAAWRLLHGHDVPPTFDLRRDGEGVVSQLGSCDIDDPGDGEVKWSVNRQHLRLIIARRGIEARVAP